MRTTFAADARTPGHARRFVVSGLDALLEPGQPPPGDDLLLIVSELVTNAVRAGAGTIDLDVRATPERVDVRVTDDAAGTPVPRHADHQSVDGRGLTIVEQLTDTWSAQANRRGKTVTATWFRGLRSGS